MKLAYAKHLILLLFVQQIPQELKHLDQAVAATHVTVVNFFRHKSETLPGERPGVDVLGDGESVLPVPTSGRIALAMVEATPATTLDSDSRLRLGVTPVRAGIDGGPSKLSWFPDAIILAHSRICGIVNFKSCLFSAQQQSHLHHL